MEEFDARFTLYRYQILPRYRHGVMQVPDQGILTPEDLLLKKNQFFRDALEKILEKEGVGSYKVKKEAADKDFILFRFAPPRKIRREIEFKKESLQHWPSILIGVWNSPDKQIIAVEERTNVFQETETAPKILVSAINRNIKENQLVVEHQAITESKHFWEVIESHKGKITTLSFDLITPNMAEISDTLSDDIKDLAKATNSAHVKFDMHAPEGAALELSKDDTRLNGIVEYASKGGGITKIKIRKARKFKSANNLKKEIVLEGIDIESSTPSAVIKELIKLLKDLK